MHFDSMPYWRYRRYTTSPFRNLEYPLWFVNADLFVEYDSSGFVPKWLFDVVMLGKDNIFNGDTDVVYRIGRDIQRLWRIQKERDPITVPTM